MILEMKSPMMAATIHEARGETQRTLTVTIRASFVKKAISEHGLDLAVLLAVLTLIGVAACN